MMSIKRYNAHLLSTLVVLSTLLSPTGTSAQESERQAAAKILKATNIKGGLIIHVGCGDGRLTAALRATESFQVHGLDQDAANVAAARKYVMSTGLYGTVAIDRISGKALPYIDNLANLIVSEDLGAVTMEEVIRVLAPNGIAYIKVGDNWKTTVKPRPDDIDEWTHFLHDASGNAVAHDDQVGPPKHLQWLGSPRWSRHHDRMASMSALVSAGGRIFYIMDESSLISIQMPSKWMLVARDAFNGTILWKKPIKTWHSHLWPLKSGPTQLARRLVATGDRVFVTLGFHAPVSEIDAATGEVVRTYKDTATTEEIIVHEGMVFLLVNKGKFETDGYEPKFNTGDQARVRKEFTWNEDPREVMAFDTGTGKRLWNNGTKVSPLTMTADDQRVIFHDGQRIVSLDRYTGKELWHSAPVSRRPKYTMNFGPKLVLHGDVVLFAGGDRKMRALSKEDGKQLWEAPHAQSGYQSPEDLLVSGGLVWNAPTTSGRDTGVFTGRDPKTGEVKIEFPPNVETYWFHHRCYIAKATDKFLLPSRTGIEFVDTKKKDWNINHWVRGGCLYGIMPCNGMVYAPPHNCACYPEAKLYGLNALGPASSTRRLPEEISDDGRLERGPAYGEVIAIDEKSSFDWPTYRGNVARTGNTSFSVPSDIKESWTTNLGGRLSATVVAKRRLFVAQVDKHTLHALDAETGKKLWNYTTGGRIDSPPTIHLGRVLFGSADGWVYCLRASDGELVWRFRAAPRDQRLMAFEQLESVWPVHGSVTVVNNEAWFVAGRSNFLDGGLRLFRLNATTGEKLAEKIIDDRDPDTNKNLQVRLQTLQMPVGLPDVLSYDGKSVYMRSQQFDMEGNRVAVGPHSGQAADQGAVQKGDTGHLFAPMGFLDDTWFHRSYWVYGRSFAGGHNGYYQAAKNAPSGRILVADDKHVYGFGRKPKYLRWTTTIEHQLFSADKKAPEGALEVVKSAARRGRGRSTMIAFGKPKSLNPTKTPLAVSAWVKAEKPDGVIVARGGPSQGFALTLRKGKPQFAVRTGGELSAVTAEGKVGNKWVHLTGVLTADKQLQIYVNGELAAKAKGTDFITSDPAQGLEVGADDQGSVGNYRTPFAEVCVECADFVVGQRAEEQFDFVDRAVDQTKKRQAGALLLVRQG